MNPLTQSKWLYNGEFLSAPIPDAIGFIYLITNLKSNKKYIGKKLFYKTITRKPLKGQKRKRRTIVESDWRDYNSSSDNVQKDIEELGIESFRFEIIQPCYSKGDLSYQELKLQVENEVLFRDDYYNGIIQCRISKRHLTA